MTYSQPRPPVETAIFVCGQMFFVDLDRKRFHSAEELNRTIPFDSDEGKRLMYRARLRACDMDYCGGAVIVPKWMEERCIHCPWCDIAMPHPPPF